MVAVEPKLVVGGGATTGKPDARAGGKPVDRAVAIRPGQSIELLKELHILTVDGRMNQDSRRKLKQVYHLTQFIEPLLDEVLLDHADIQLVDHGAGKSYLGFILYDLFFKSLSGAPRIYGIDSRESLVEKSHALAAKLDFPNMTFLYL